MKGTARVYDHVTPAMVNEILDVLEERLKPCPSGEGQGF